MENSTKKIDNKFILVVLLAILFIGSGGIFVRWSEVGPINAAFYRISFVVVVLFPFAFKKMLKLPKKQIALLLLAGLFYSFDLSFWNLSLLKTSVANATLLSNMVSFTIIPVSYFLYKEKITKKFFIGLGVAILGLVVLLNGKLHSGLEYIIGDMIAFLASICYGLYLATIYKMRDKVDADTTLFTAAISAMFFLFIYSCVFEGFQVPQSLMGWMPLLALGLFPQFLGQGLMTWSLGKLKASLVSVLVLTQPLAGALFGYVFFGEVLSAIEIVGMLITLFGIYLAKKSQE